MNRGRQVPNLKGYQATPQPLDKNRTVCVYKLLDYFFAGAAFAGAVAFVAGVVAVFVVAVALAAAAAAFR